MVLIANRLERGPVSSGVGMFPEVFSVSDSRSKSMEDRVGWGLMLGEFCDDRCMFIK